MKFDKISDFFSVISAVLVVFGMTYNILLYKNFNVDISEYISLTESLMLFLPALPKFLLLLPLMLLAYDVLRPSVVYSEKINEDYALSNLFDGFFLTKKGILWTSSIFIVVSIVAFVLSATLNIRSFRFLGYGAAFAFVAMFLPVTLRMIFNSLKHKKLPRSVPIFIYLGIFFSLVVLISVDTKTFRIVHGFKNPSVHLIFSDDKTMITDSIIRYIGKTDNFIFFYNKTTKATSIIPISEIKEYKYSDWAMTE